MAEIKNKIITAESLSVLHEYNKNTYETKVNVETLLNTKLNKSDVIPITNGGTGSSDTATARANLEAQKQHIATSVTLTVDGWVENMQVINVDGVTEDNAVIVTPASASRTVYMEADVHCSAQSNKSLTFKCEEKPKIELMVNVLIFD